MAEGEEKNPEEESQEIRKKGPPVKKIIIAVTLLFVLGGGFFTWHSGVLAGLLGKEGKSGTSSAKGKGGQKVGIGPIYSMDTFIVNLTGQGKNYLKAKVELELDDEPALEEINKRLPQLRDTILLILSSKGFMDINTLEGKYQLRAEMMAMLNQHLKSGQITNIYFTDFIIQ